MSADNWGICPKCKKDFVEEPSPYGKISEEEYQKWLEEHEDDPDLETTLREDYWQGTDEDGTYTISYHCSCDVCGFKFQYEYSVNVLEEKK